MVGQAPTARRKAESATPESPLGRLRRFTAGRRANRTRRGRALTALVCVVIGVMIAASASYARGVDLRTENRSLADLVTAQSATNSDLANRVSELRGQVDTLAAQRDDRPDGRAELETANLAAGTQAVSGPAVTVTLDDAPDSVQPAGVDDDLLVVHQQDIQSVVNVLWESGAEAMTIQGQRVVSTTGIKCVGNTVVLHGIPYAPPYEIQAIGDQDLLEQGLARSEFVGVYKQYVDAYNLGWSQRRVPQATFEGFKGAVELQHARPAD